MPGIVHVGRCGVWVALAASLATASLRVLLYGTAGDLSPLVSVLCSLAAVVPAWRALGLVEAPEEDLAILRALLIGAATPTLMFVGEGGGVMPSWCMGLVLVFTSPSSIGALTVLAIPAVITGAATWRLSTPALAPVRIGPDAEPS